MDLLAKQQEKIDEIAKEYGLRLVLLFGSRASGKTHKESDYDVAYLAENNLTFDEANRLNSDFTGVFQCERVDTVDIKTAPPLLLYGIFRQCQILFQQNDSVFSAYRAYAYKKYVEAKPILEEKRKRLIAQAL